MMKYYVDVVVKDGGKFVLSRTYQNKVDTLNFISDTMSIMDKKYRIHISSVETI